MKTRINYEKIEQIIFNKFNDKVLRLIINLFNVVNGCTGIKYEIFFACDQRWHCPVSVRSDTITLFRETLKIVIPKFFKQHGNVCPTNVSSLSGLLLKALLLKMDSSTCRLSDQSK